tara:strand:- start:4332 stop:4550 length:219 start_codon:yes stop_codon:yes gene_type:complete
MDNQQKKQLLQTKFISNNNVNKLKTNTIIKEKFVGGGYKTFMEIENKLKNNNNDNVEKFVLKPSFYDKCLKK